MASAGCPTKQTNSKLAPGQVEKINKHIKKKPGGGGVLQVSKCEVSELQWGEIPAPADGLDNIGKPWVMGLCKGALRCGPLSMPMPGFGAFLVNMQGCSLVLLFSAENMMETSASGLV